MGRIPDRYAKYYQRGAKPAQPVTKTEPKVPARKEVVIAHLASVEVVGAGSMDAPVSEMVALEVSGPETQAEVAEVVEGALSEEVTPADEGTSTGEDAPAGDDSVEGQPSGEEDDSPAADKPDYASMTWQELRRLVPSEEESTLPDLKKSTLVDHLDRKWEADNA